MRLPRSRLTRTAVFGFSLAIVSLFIVDVFAYSSIGGLVRNADRVVHTHRVLDELNGVLTELKNAETGQRGFLLTGDDNYLAPYDAAVRQIHEEARRLAELTRDNAVQQARLEIVQRLVDEKLAELHETIELRREQGFEAAVAVVRTDRGKRLMDEIRVLVNQMKDAELELLNTRDAATSRQTARTVVIMSIGSVLGILLMCAALFVIVIDIRKREWAEDALRAANAEMEARVDRRTTELRRANVALREEISQKETAQNELRKTVVTLVRSYADARVVLNSLRVGTVILDADGNVSFVSDMAQSALRIESTEAEGRPWHEVLRFSAPDQMRLRQLMSAPPERRERLPLEVAAGSGLRFRMEIDVQTDPRDGAGCILLLHDVTEIYDIDMPAPASDAARYGIIGQSEGIRAVIRQIRALADVDTTVLIEGETGTGKELIARALHSTGRRADRPFIAVNAAALTESLAASQLFGHRRGAFTGAVTDQLGYFEAAQGGTLFLDEIGDIPLSLQTTLLRALQESEITRVGDSRPRRIDVRFIAATHRDLVDEVERNRFRADLLYRIRVARISLPPLRERREDIPPLVAAFLAQIDSALHRGITDVDLVAMARLFEYTWPGNVRELRSALEHAALHAQGAVIRTADLPPEIQQFQRTVVTGVTTTTRVGRDSDQSTRVLAALKAASGNRVRAARLLGISRSTLYRQLERMGGRNGHGD